MGPIFPLGLKRTFLKVEFVFEKFLNLDRVQTRQGKILVKMFLINFPYVYIESV